MSLYAEYLRERTNDRIIEGEFGFATYRFLDGGKVYLIDIFVVPEKRKSGLATSMANQIAAIAKEHGCTKMLGTVNPQAKGSTNSLKVLLAYGMSLQNIADGMVVFGKEI